jgi:predicted transcriptional regulator
MMTDKQIIIDDVDVSECEFYKNTNWKNCYSRDYKESVCQSNHNCYYKQLKRKEQECEAYKMEAEEGKEINAELKAELEQEKAWHKTSDEISKANSKYTAKLKQTLTEIKETAEKAREDLYTCESIIYADDDLREILQKISECEVVYE